MRMCISLYRCHLKISLKSHHKWWKGRQQQQQKKWTITSQAIYLNVSNHKPEPRIHVCWRPKKKHWNWSIYKQHWIVYDAHTQNNKAEYELNSRCLHVSVCMNVSRINTTPKTRNIWRHWIWWWNIAQNVYVLSRRWWWWRRRRRRRWQR